MKKNVLFLFAVIVLMVSCYPGGAEYYDEMDIVYTQYDEKFDFKSKVTYAMPDTIVKITGNLLTGEQPEFVDKKYAEPMLKRINDNMKALGWTKVTDPTSADVVIFPAAWTNTTVYYWYDYWCWYYYYCGWGYYYPSVSSYTTGTFVMTMIPKAQESIEPTGVWDAAINGLLSGSYDVTRVNNAIDQAFEQSPYLNTK